MSPLSAGLVLVLLELPWSLAIRSFCPRRPVQSGPAGTEWNSSPLVWMTHFEDFCLVLLQHVMLTKSQLLH